MNDLINVNTFLFLLRVYQIIFKLIWETIYNFNSLSTFYNKRYNASIQNLDAIYTMNVRYDLTKN